MLAQVVLTPTESKKLIAKAVARMDVVTQAVREGTVVLHPSSSTYFIVEELTGTKPNTNSWVCGVVSPRGMCAEMGTLAGERALTKMKGPVDFRHSWVIRDSKLLVGEYLSELLEKMRPEDVYVKGVNALDFKGNAGVLVGNATEGGTYGKVVAAWRKKPFNLIHPVGLEKLIPIPIEQATKEAKRVKCDYAMGIACGLFPCPGGKTVTELDAIEILSGATAVQIAAGGLGGAEGAVTLVIKGDDEQVKKAIAYVEQSKGARLPQLRLCNCYECLAPTCGFPVGDKHWVTV